MMNLFSGRRRQLPSAARTAGAADDNAADRYAEIHQEYFDVGEEPGDDDESRGAGCLWMILLIGAVLLGLVLAVGWGVQELLDRRLVSPLRRSYQDVSLMPAREIQPAEVALQIHLYFPARGQALAAVTRELRQPASAAERIDVVAREIARPPSAEFLRSPLPAGAQIRGKYLLQGILWVDLSEDFLKVSDPSPLREQLSIYALVNSFMLNETSIQGVRFMIEGRPIDAAWGWLDLSAPLGPDLSLIH